jgi:hypothetical protein
MKTERPLISFSRCALNVAANIASEDEHLRNSLEGGPDIANYPVRVLRTPDAFNNTQSGLRSSIIRLRHIHPLPCVVSFYNVTNRTI